MNKYQEALDRLKTTMSDGDSAYKSYTDSYTVFTKDINTIQELIKNQKLDKELALDILMAVAKEILKISEEMETSSDLRKIKKLYRLVLRTKKLLKYEFYKNDK